MNYPIDAQCSLNKLRRKGAKLRYFTFYKIISNVTHNLRCTFHSNERGAVNKLTSLLGALISIEYLDDAILCCL